MEALDRIREDHGTTWAGLKVIKQQEEKNKIFKGFLIWSGVIGMIILLGIWQKPAQHAKCFGIDPRAWVLTFFGISLAS